MGANTLLLKRSGTSSETPTASELSHGELGINYADGKLFFKNSSNTVQELLSAPAGSNGSVQISNGSTLSSATGLSWDSGNSLLKVPKLKINNAITFPVADGSSDQVLKTDGSGNLSWTTISAGLWSKSGTTLSPTTSGDGISVGVGTFTGTATIHNSLPLLELKDTGTGNAINGYVKYSDGNGVERAWVGYGSSSNQTFSVMNSLGDTSFYASDTLALTLAGANATFGGTIQSESITMSNNEALKGKETGGTAKQLIGMNNSNVILVAGENHAVSTGTGAWTFGGDIYGNDRLYLGTKMALDINSEALYLGSTTGDNRNTTLHLRSNDGPVLDCDSNKDVKVHNQMGIGVSPTVGQLHIEKSSDGGWLAYMNNTHSGGYGLKIKAGSDGGDYAFLIENQDSSSHKFKVDGAGDVTAQGIYVGGSIIPSTDDAVDLGSSSKKFRSIYVGADSLHIGDTTVSESDFNAYATESYVGTQIANLIDSSPAALNTLNELAAAINDDASYATTVNNALATKANLTAADFTGDVTVSSGAQSFKADSGAPGGSNREIARFQAQSSRPIAVGWIDSGSKMSIYTPDDHSLVLGTGAIGTNNLEINAAGNASFSGEISSGSTIVAGGSIRTDTSTNYALLTGYLGGLRVKSDRSGAAGIILQEGSGTHITTLYGETDGDYGFLDDNWGNWDIKKRKGADMELDISGTLRTVIHTANLATHYPKANWDTAYGWGNHASAGYTTASNSQTFTNKGGNISQWTNDSNYITTSLYEGSNTNRRLHLTGSGDNVLRVGVYDDDQWGYLYTYNTSNGLYFNVDSGGTFAFDTGHVRPYTDGENSLGTSSYKWDDIHFSGWARQYGNSGMYWNSHGMHLQTNATDNLKLYAGSDSDIKISLHTSGDNYRGGILANSNDFQLRDKDGDPFIKHQHNATTIFYINNSSAFTITGSGVSSAGTIGGTNLSGTNTGDVCSTNHTSAGYLTASSSATLTNKGGNISQWTNNSGYLTSHQDISGKANLSGANFTGNITTDGYLEFDGTHDQQLYTGTHSLVVKNMGTAGSGGILQLASGGAFCYQLYGDGTNYGFLDGAWAHWDFKKVRNGKLYMNDNETYYMQTDGASYFGSTITVNSQGNSSLWNTGYNERRYWDGAANTGFNADTAKNSLALNTGNGVQFARVACNTGDDANYNLKVNGNMYASGSNAYFQYTNNYGAYLGSNWRKTLVGGDHSDIATNNGAICSNEWFRTYGNGGHYWNNHDMHLYSNADNKVIIHAGGSTHVEFELHTSGSNKRGSFYANNSDHVGILDAGGSWAYRIQNDSTHYWCTNDNTTRMTLTTSGTLTATGDVVAYSDGRLKENINTIDSALDKVVKMRGVTYDRTDVEKFGTGVVAQELEEIAPELVNNENEYKAVSYNGLNAYLIEAIKELKQEIEELKQNGN